MKRIIEKFGKLLTASFFVIAIGIIAFLLTPLLYGLWGIDSDLPGIIVISVGLAICIVGIIRRKKLHGWKLMASLILAAILSMPALSLIVSLVYYLITGRELGS